MVAMGGADNYGTGGLVSWAKKKAKKVGRAAKNIERDLTKKLCDSLPSWAKSAMDLQRKNPWRSIMLGMSVSAVTYSPYLLVPFSLPLAIAQVPMMVFLFQVRFFFDVIVNCGSVSRAVQNNACDLRDMLNLISPSSDSGRMIGQVLTMAGQSGALDAVNEWSRKARPFLDTLCSGDLPSIKATLGLAKATAKAADNPEMLAMARKSEREWSQVEAQVIEAAAELDVLAADAEGFTGEGRRQMKATSISGPTGRRKKKKTAVKRTRPGKKQKDRSGRARDKARREKAERDAAEAILRDDGASVEEMMDPDYEPPADDGLPGWVVPASIAGVVLAIGGAMAMRKKK